MEAAQAQGQSQPQQQQQHELSTLNALSEEQLADLVQLVFDLLLNPKAANFQEKLAEYAERHSMNAAALKSMARELILFLRQCTQKNSSDAQLRRDCERSGVAEEAIAVITRLWEENRGSLSLSLVSRTIAANELVDMEWKFGVTASSDEQAQVGSTFLQMKLVIDKGGGGGNEVVQMELSLPQFYQYLAEMERAKAYLDFLSEN